MSKLADDYQLYIGLKSIDGVPLVAIAGECDAFTATYTHGALIALIGEGYTGIIVDISDLVFLDVAGFHALEDCCREMRDAGGKMLLVNPTKHVEEIYEILREQGGCEIVKSLDEAYVKLNISPAT